MYLPSFRRMLFRREGMGFELSPGEIRGTFSFFGGDSAVRKRETRQDQSILQK
jgi:hypothetical protein